MRLPRIYDAVLYVTLDIHASVDVQISETASKGLFFGQGWWLRNLLLTPSYRIHSTRRRLDKHPIMARVVCKIADGKS
jgi:hypothetical protein